MLQHHHLPGATGLVPHGKDGVGAYVAATCALLKSHKAKTQNVRVNSHQHLVTFRSAAAQHGLASLRGW